jgi:hypothetical protein
MRRRGLRRPLTAAVSVVFAASGLLATAGMSLAANTRMVYFGSPEDVCPSTILSDPAGYPNGCGGGIDGSGAPYDGIIVLSPTAVSTTNSNTKLVGYRLKVANTGGQTLTKVVVLGGTQAGLTTNPLYAPPPDRTPPLAGTLGSLPPGFSYAAVYAVSGPAPSCAITSSSATSRDDGLRCDYGNLAAGATPSVITIVMQAPMDVASAVCADTGDICRVWNELQLNEGSSSSGSNADSFFAVSQLGGLALGDSTDVYAESFVAPAGAPVAGETPPGAQSLATTPSFSTSAANPMVTRLTIPRKADGSDARILETGFADDIEEACALAAGKLVTCFGQVSNVDVLTPINITPTGGQAPELFGDCPYRVDDPTYGTLVDLTRCTTTSSIAPLRIDLAWDGSQLPGRVNTRSLVIVHVYQLLGLDADGDPQLVYDTNGDPILAPPMVVSNSCPSGPTSGTPLPCRGDATKFGKNGLQVSIWTASNGGWKPGY